MKRRYIDLHLRKRQSHESKKEAAKQEEKEGNPRLSFYSANFISLSYLKDNHYV